MRKGYCCSPCGLNLECSGGDRSPGDSQFDSIQIQTPAIRLLNKIDASKSFSYTHDLCFSHCVFAAFETVLL